MLKGLTSTFKNGCNNVEVMYSEYLVLGNQTIPIKAELSDDSYENGNFIGTFIFKTIKFETDAQYDFKNKEFEYYKEVNGESIKIGTFITTEVEINDTTEIVKVVGMDYGLKTQVSYKSQLDYSAGNITLLDVWNEACQLSGLESGIDYFPNGDFIVDNDQFTGTGATIRDVFKGIAMSSGSFVKVMNDDKIYLVFNSYTGDTETTTINGSGSISDSFNGGLIDFQVEGKAEQHSYTGKNYANTNKDPDWKYGNTVWERSGSNVTVKNNGTSTYASAGYYIDNLKHNTTYTISFDVNISVGVGSIDVQKIRDGTASASNRLLRLDSSTSGHVSGQFTTPSDTSTMSINLYSLRGTYYANASVTYSNVQIEEGSSETSYEPYTNNLPTPNPYYPEEIKTVSGIGNLFDESQLLSATGWSKNSNGYYNGTFGDLHNEFGTSTNGFNFIETFKNNTSYTISFNAYVSTSTVYIRFYYTDNTYITISVNSTTATKYTLTTDNSKTISRIIGSYSTGGENILYIKDIQLVEGIQEKTNVPYGHWLPVKVSNKNLFDKNNVIPVSTATTVTQIDTGIQIKNNTAGYGAKINITNLKQNTDYYLSYNWENVSNGENRVFVFAGTGTSTTLGSKINGDFVSFNTGSNTTINIWFYAQRNAIGEVKYKNIQLEENNEETAYIEHQEQTTLIDLNKYDENNNIIGNYEICTTLTAPANNLDVLTIKDGRAVLTKRMGKYVADSNSPFYKTGTTDGLYHLSSISTPTIPYVGYRGISNCFINNPDTRITANSQANQYLSDGQFAFRWAGAVADRERIYFKYLAIPNDITAFKQLMIDNNFTLYYRQNKEDIILRGTYDISLYEGVNHISIEDELEPTMVMSYYKDNLDIIEDYVELEDKRDTRPWTCLRLGMSQVEGENVDYIDEDLVAKYGENWLILNDNPFAYTQQKRQQLITNIFNRIKEFGYSAFVSKTSFKPYLTAGDIVKFRNREGNLVKTILLRYNHNAEEIILEAPSETSATVNYVYPLTDIDLYKRTEIQVDKANNQIRTNVDNIGLLQTSSSSNADNINTLTSLVDSQGEEIERLGTRITQNVDSINASVSAIQGEIEQGVGLVKTTSVTIDDNGLSVSTDTSKIQTTMTNDTFKITDNGRTELAKFGYDENEGISIAEMDNLTVKNYFIAGVHRIETIEIDGEERTGWFYMGG